MQTAPKQLYPRTVSAKAKHTFARAMARVFAVAFVASVVATTGVFLYTRSVAHATATTTLNFQARLLSNSGNLVADGTYNIEFNLYSVSSGGSSLWTEDYLNNASQGVSVKNGFLSVQLGSLTGFPSTINWDQQLWLGMTVRGTGSCAFGSCTPADSEMTPRFKLSAVPYAFQAANALGVSSNATSTASTNSGNVTVTTGNASGATSNSGNLSIDTGTATGTAGTISLGASNASALTLGRSGLTTTNAGNLTVQGGTLTIGTTSQAASLLLNDGNGGQTATLQVGNIAANTVLTIPAAVGTTDTFCLLTLNNCAGTTPTLQIAYNNATSPEITLNSTNGALSIRDNSTPIGANLLEVQNNAGTTTYLAVAAAGTTVGNDLTVAASKSLILTGSGSLPGSPTAGQIYYDSTNKRVLQYDGTQWNALNGNGTATYVVAASNSVNPYLADYRANGNTGAANDGDQVEINSAITAANTAGGGIVYLMEGTYTIDATITMLSNVTLVGAGEGTIITIPNALNATSQMIYINSNNDVVVRNMKLDGNKANQSSGQMDGITINGRGRIQNVHVTNEYGQGITGTSTGVSVSDVVVENSRLNGMYANFGGGTITGSKFLNNTQNGIQMNGSNVTISDNYFEGNASSNSYGNINISAANIVVSGNTIKSGAIGIINLGNAGSVITGNHIASTTNDGMQLVLYFNSTVSGNFVKSAGNNGITLSTVHDSTVSGNSVDSSTNYGFYISGNRNTITGNIASNNASSGIYVKSGDANTISSNNSYNNGGAGAGSGIELDNTFGPTNTKIVDNTIRDTAGTGYAINIAGSPTTGTYVSGNTYSGTGASTINDTATNTQYVNQVDSNGNIITRGQAAIGFNTFSPTASLQNAGGFINGTLSTPSAPTVITQGTAGSTSYTYAVTATDGVGETLASSGTVIATGNATLNGTNFNRITPVRVSGAITYKIYRTAAAGTPSTTGLIGTLNATASTFQFDDTGLAGSGSTPSANTTGGANIQGSLLTLGTSSSINGGLKLLNSTNAFAVTVSASAQTTGSATFTFPDTLGVNDTICLQTKGNCAAAAGTYITNGTTLQTNANMNIQSAAVGSVTVALRQLGSQSADILQVRNSGNTANLSGIDASGNFYLGSTASLKIAGDVTANRPSSPTEGQVWFDTTTKSLLVYANSKWQADRSNSTYIVAASNAVNKDKADYVATGSADQTPINNAITAANTAGGGVVYLTEGTFTLSAQITMKDNVRLVGSGKGTVITIANALNPANLNLIASSGTNVNYEIRDLSVNANNTNQSGVTTLNGISVGSGASTGTSSVRGVIIDNVTVTDPKGSGIVASGNHNTISNSFVDCNNSGSVPASTGGIVITSNTDSIVTNNRITDCGGIYAVSSTASTIANNVITNSGGTGSGAIDIQSSNKASVTGNTVTSQVNASGGGIYFISANDATITGNTVAASGGRGIWGSGSYNVISGNIVNTTTGYSIYLAGGSYMTVANNTVESGTVEGIFLLSANNSQVVNNHIKGNGGSGINISGTTDVVVSGNYLYDNAGSGNTNNIQIGSGFGSSANTRVVNNTIIDTAGTGAAIGIFSSTTTGTYLSGNTYSGTGATSISDSGTNTQYYNQLDSSGNLITRGQAGIGLNTTSPSASLQNAGGFINGTLATPGAPTVTTQGTAGSTSYTYAVTATDGIGETLASSGTVIATGNATLNGTNFNRIVPARVSGAITYKIYRTAAGGTPSTTGLIGTLSAGAATFQFDDTGLAGSGSAPTSNTTGSANVQGSLLTLGTSSSINGGLKLLNSTNAFAVTVSAANQTVGNATISIPNTSGVNDTFCLATLANCAGGATTTLQQAYDNDANGSDVTVSLTSTDGSLIFTNPSSSGTSSGYLARFNQQNTGAVNGLEITSAGSANILEVHDDGTFTDTTPFVVDASGRVGIQYAAPVAELTVNGNQTFVANHSITFNSYYSSGDKYLSTDSAFQIWDDNTTDTLRIQSASVGTINTAVSYVDALTVATTGNITLGQDLAVNGGDITTSATTFNLLNTTVTTANLLGAATTINIGAQDGNTFLKSDNLYVGYAGPEQLIGGGNAGLTVTTEPQTGGNTGGLTLSTGTATTSGNSGSIAINSGNVTSGSVGSITIDNGSGNTSGTPTINIGTTNARTLQFGNTSSAVAQTFNIGNNATSGSSSTVTIGSLQDGSTTTLQAGTGYINLNASTFVRGSASSTLSGLATTSSNIVTGTSTAFTTELQVGDRITISGQTRSVLQINSNTQVIVDTVYSPAIGTPASITRLPASFRVRANGVSNANQLTVQDGGWVGIGTVAPGALLDVDNSNSVDTRALHVNGIFTATSGNFDAVTTDLFVNPSTAATSGYLGNQVFANIVGSVASSTVTGFKFGGTYQASSGISSITGYESSMGFWTTPGTIGTYADFLARDGFRGETAWHATNYLGVAIEDRDNTFGTNTVNLLIGSAGNNYDTSVPSGDFSIYNASADDNVFAGNLRIGSTAAPTVALDVTGAGKFSSDLTVNGTNTNVKNILPLAANTYDIGSTTLEVRNIYTGDGSGLVLGSAQAAAIKFNNTNNRVELSNGGSNAGSLWIEDRLSLGTATYTLTDDGVANDSITPVTSFYKIDEDETNNAGVPDLVIGESGAQNGDLLVIVNTELDGTNGQTFTITNNATVVNLPGAVNITLGPNDSITLMYVTDRWVTIARSDN